MADVPGVPATRTHDWSRLVDLDHLASIRARGTVLAPGGSAHLLVEVLAYPAEEAAENGGGRCEVTFLPDGSIRVSDDGRGTEVAVGADGRVVRKPVMATRDVRFFDADAPPLLPDGHPRRGMSVVAALSSWLQHTNRRAQGAWTQRYEHGVPVAGLDAAPPDGATGTTVHFMPDASVAAVGVRVDAASVLRWAEAWPQLDVHVRDERP